jgi:methyl-accepting chemotaxis protein
LVEADRSSEVGVQFAAESLPQLRRIVIMGWFKDLKIFTKLLFGFVLVATFAGLVGAVGLWNMTRLNASNEDMYANQLMPIRELGNLNAETQINRVLTRDLLIENDLTKRQRIADSIEAHAKAASEALEKYKKTQMLDEEKAILPKYEGNLAEYRMFRKRMIDAALRKQDAEAERTLKEAQALAAAMVEQLNSLISINNKAAEEGMKTNASKYSSARQQVIALVLGAVALAIFLGVMIGKVIARPVTALAMAAEKLASGDINVEIAASSKDELGVLACSFHAMAENLRKLSAAANKMSDGDLTTKTLARSEVDVLGIALDGTAKTLRTLIEDMARMAHEHDAGDIDVMIDAAKFNGAYKEVAQGINSMVSGHISVKKKSMACIGEFGRGNFEAPLERFPGKKAFINETIEQMRTNLKALIADADLLAKAGIQGSLSTRADATKHYGDFRKIVDGVNNTLDAVVTPILEVSSLLDRISGGDLTLDITKDYAGDFNRLKQSLNATSLKFRTALNQIGNTTTALVSAAEELSRVSQQMSASAQQTAAQANAVSAGSEQVSRNVQTVATGAEEMSASIKEIAKSTADASHVAVAAVRTAEQTNSTIEKLGQSSAEIGEVIKVITSIAQQTNLLALNATIEAARAGEAGKGFAVVANEVKELAKETAKATDDIGRKIEAIQTDTKAAVAAIHEIGGVITKVNDISNTIASAVEEQSATTNEIGRNLGEAAKGSQDIVQNISGVAEAAATTTAGASETQKAAQSLEQMSAQLQSAISQFRYDRRQTTGYVNGSAMPAATHLHTTDLVQ